MGNVPSFGAWLKRRRKALDLTQDALAQLVGCAVVTIRKLEAEVQPPSRQLAERLADQLAIPEEQRATFIQFARLGLDAAPPELPLPEEARVPEPPSTRLGLPSGTVTFLFTDIEGSTQLWERHASAMPAALARHTAILQHAIATQEGVVFKTVGDGVCAAFGQAPTALAAALVAQRNLQAEEWGATGPLRVRMALHTGTITPQAGDYLGPPLNRVARLLASGHGGQILLSGATAELMHEALPPDATLRDLGE